MLIADSNVNNLYWIQVDLGSPTRVTGVITQGRPNHDKWEQWVTSYNILYGNSISHLVKIQDQTSSEDLVSYKILAFKNFLQYQSVYWPSKQS